jgi:hypothetical protein
VELVSVIVLNGMGQLIKVLEQQVELTRQDIKDQAQQNYEIDKKCLELGIFLWHWMFENMETMRRSLASAKVSKSKQSASELRWEVPSSAGSRLKALNIIRSFLLVNLDVVFISKSDIELIINEYVVFKVV